MLLKVSKLSKWDKKHWIFKYSNSDFDEIINLIINNLDYDYIELLIWSAELYLFNDIDYILLNDNRKFFFISLMSNAGGSSIDWYSKISLQSPWDRNFISERRKNNSDWSKHISSFFCYPPYPLSAHRRQDKAERNSWIRRHIQKRSISNGFSFQFTNPRAQRPRIQRGILNDVL